MHWVTFLNVGESANKRCQTFELTLLIHTIGLVDRAYTSRTTSNAPTFQHESMSEICVRVFMLLKFVTFRLRDIGSMCCDTMEPCRKGAWSGMGTESSETRLAHPARHDKERSAPMQTQVP